MNDIRNEDSPPELLTIFNKINEKYFDSFLDPPKLSWNLKFRSTGGTFLPGIRKRSQVIPPCIEIAGYLRDEKNAEQLIDDALAHEMIHYWLWVRGLDYGHTSLFLEKMKSMSVSRYNTAPLKARCSAKSMMSQKQKTTKQAVVYSCKTCLKTFNTVKKLKSPLACQECCEKYAKGKYDVRFSLVLVQKKN